ncbi:hypothetical protein EVA_14903 [gut metagenome]|uniref:Uncharacterized protein n=1 Tax=gut metagenome TaxID=749906 RepID=J9FPW3_9ZZZZ
MVAELSKYASIPYSSNENIKIDNTVNPAVSVRKILFPRVMAFAFACCTAASTSDSSKPPSGPINTPTDCPFSIFCMISFV